MPNFGETATIALPNPNNTPLYYIGFEDDWNVWTAFDNIRLTPVPEPGAVALLVGAAVPGLMFVCRRMRRGRKTRFDL